MKLSTMRRTRRWLVQELNRIEQKRDSDSAKLATRDGQDTVSGLLLSPVLTRR